MHEFRNLTSPQRVVICSSLKSIQSRRSANRRIRVDLLIKPRDLLITILYSIKSRRIQGGSSNRTRWSSNHYHECMSIRYNLSMPMHSITYQTCICNFHTCHYIYLIKSYVRHNHLFLNTYSSREYITQPCQTRKHTTVPSIHTYHTDIRRK